MAHPADALPAEITVHRDLAYVAEGHPRQVLDLYLPRSSRPLPLIVWIHGGAFRMGSKEDDVPLEQLDAGYAIAAINYRLSQHAIFPAQIEDCKAAVRWLRAHAEAYGIDPARIAALGTSAGGHLAAMLGTTGSETALDVGDHLDHPSRVQAVVDFYGPTDFLQMDSHRPSGGMVHDTPDSPESMLVGGPIQERQAEVARQPDHLRASRCSALSDHPRRPGPARSLPSKYTAGGGAGRGWRAGDILYSRRRRAWTLHRPTDRSPRAKLPCHLPVESFELATMH